MHRFSRVGSSLDPSISRSLDPFRSTPRTLPTFYHRVYALVRRVPRGKVATYGQVAALLGRPRGARAVGMALAALERPLLDEVPWQRVINGAGRCSHRDGFWAEIQRDLLTEEGIRFDRNGRLDLQRVRWSGPRTRASGGAGARSETSRGRKTHRSAR